MRGEFDDKEQVFLNESYAQAAIPSEEAPTLNTMTVVMTKSPSVDNAAVHLIVYPNISADV